MAPRRWTSTGSCSTPAAATASRNMDSLPRPPRRPPTGFNPPGRADGATQMALNGKLFNAGGGNRITQYGQPSAPAASAQDGSAAAQMTRIGLGKGGLLLAQYS